MFIRYFDPDDRGPGDYLEDLGLIAERSAEPERLMRWLRSQSWDAAITFAAALPKGCVIPPEAGPLIFQGSGPDPLPPKVWQLGAEASRQEILETVLRCRKKATRIGASSELLRGLAHAISNPVASALGWAQLLGDGDRKAVDGIRGELLRVQQLARSLAVIGLRPSLGRSPLMLMNALTPALNQAREQGLELIVNGGLSGVVLADAGELRLLFDLLFGALCEERRLPQGVSVSCRQAKEVMEIQVVAEGADFPTKVSPQDLCGLLSEGRRTKALALAVAEAVMVKRLGGELIVHPNELILRAPCQRASAVDIQAGGY